MSHRSPSTMRKSSSGHHRQSESRSPLRMRKSCSDHHRNGQSESRSPSMMRKSSSGQSESNALRKHAIRKNHWQPISNEDLNNLLRVVIPPPSKSPWAFHAVPESLADCGLRGSLVRENGHIYSLAAAGDLLYTGSESKNIRVWKNQTEFSAFKSSSGLVKAIVVDADRVLSGHQDGKIRIWRPSEKNPTVYQRVGSLPIPSLKAKIFKNSIKHLDAISCLAFSEDRSLLYSGSWDKTFKVWRVSDSKCLETVKAHDDAVNSIIAAFGGAVLTGSADGSVKVWDSLIVCNEGKTKTKHTLAETLLQQDSAVTALAADPSTSFLYGGSSDGTVVFWERGKSGSLSRGGVLRGHKLAVLCLATARSLVFSGSADTNICVWQRNGDGGHTCLSVLMGHGGPVKCLAVVEDKEASAGGGDRQYVAYSGSLDKSVKIWRATEMVRPPLRWAK